MAKGRPKGAKWRAAGWAAQRSRRNNKDQYASWRSQKGKPADSAKRHAAMNHFFDGWEEAARYAVNPKRHPRNWKARDELRKWQKKQDKEWGYKTKKKKKKNPTVADIPRNKWITAKVKVTPDGKIQAKVPMRSLKGEN